MTIIKKDKPCLNMIPKQPYEVFWCMTIIKDTLIGISSFTLVLHLLKCQLVAWQTTVEHEKGNVKCESNQF